ncbi:MAG: hypothetical protein C0598_10895 [Marinilabiliales bacterium]|nr:MAG: hypothetical protein C0598_10895 [Marinilabiliales bacterium]
MKNIKIAISLIIFSGMVLLLNSCSNKKPDTPFYNVNTFIRTGGHGHTYPGATMPFGFVQLSPDTRKDSWDGCSGYHYSDSIVYGFSHTHLSGTGVGDYGDVRIFPSVGEVKTNVVYGDNYQEGYGSKFIHEMEVAEPGYYATYLIDSDIYASFTVGTHSGFHKYMFPKSNESHILLDLIESVTSERINGAKIEIINDSTIAGFRNTSGWANNQHLFFYAKFSKAFTSWGIENNGIREDNKKHAEGDSLKAWFNFKTSAKEIVYLKVGISAVDIEGARNNLENEIPDWDFKNNRKMAKEAWENQLDKIEVFGNRDDKEIFYSALYHSFVAPNLSSDVDGRYRAHNNKIYENSDMKMHTVFSLWDTFRALHPLFTIVQQDKTNDLINSMLEMYSHDGLLPVWELAACETNCMIGYNAVPVIADAYVKGIRGYDPQIALEAMVASANSGKFGLEYYYDKGYIPANKEGESVSKTLEYAYDDWCIAEMAKLVGNEEIYNEFIERAQYYKNIYDRSTGFFRGKSNGRFVHPFDPTEVNFMLTEANTWQYNFFVPQDINTHIDLLGGDINYEAKLDSLFTTKQSLSGRHQSDITGLIGQYAHGNEPSHHMAYLYNYVGKPWKTQKIVRQIMSELYSNKPDGLAGNEDCGQMSAWYVLSSMGFYPVSPGTDKYALGSPVFDSIKINLENGNVFKIIVENNSEENIYIQSVTYNKELYFRSFITDKMLVDGGTLKMIMGPDPNMEWGLLPENRPYQKIVDNLIIPIPSFSYYAKTFENDIDVEVLKFNTEDIIYVKQNSSAYKQYNEKFTIDKTTEFIAYAENAGRNSFKEQSKLIKIPAGRKITLNTNYSSQYSAGGNIALINMLRGGQDFKTGDWQGYHAVDVNAVVDIGVKTKVKEIGMGFLQDINSWIFMPEYVIIEVSADGKNFDKIGKIENTVDVRKSGGIVKDFSIKLKKPQRIKYIRVFAKNLEKCPEWHKGAGGETWLFTDEIWFK